MPHYYDPATGEMCFANALEAMRNGKRVRRKAWGNGPWLSYVMLEQLAYINVTSKDIIAKDWIELYDDSTTD